MGSIALGETQCCPFCLFTPIAEPGEPAPIPETQLPVSHVFTGNIHATRVEQAEGVTFSHVCQHKVSQS